MRVFFFVCLELIDCEEWGKTKKKSALFDKCFVPLLIELQIESYSRHDASFYIPYTIIFVAGFHEWADVQYSMDGQPSEARRAS